MLFCTLILLSNYDFEQCNGDIDYYTMPLPMSKWILYPVRKIRIIEEYCTSRCKRDNSPDSCIPALTNPSQSVTTDTLSQRSFFCLWYECTCFCSNPVPMCSGTDAPGAYLPAKFSTKCIHLIKLLSTIACEEQEQQLKFVTKKLRSLKLRKLRSLLLADGQMHSNSYSSL